MVAKRAAGALAHIGTQSARDALRKAAQSRHSELAAIARNALENEPQGTD